MNPFFSNEKSGRRTLSSGDSLGKFICLVDSLGKSTRQKERALPRVPRSGMPLPVRTLTFTLPVDVNPGDKLTFSVAHAHFRERRRAA